MAEVERKGTQVKINSLQGLDLRSARHNLPQGTFDRLEGLYPAQTGLQQRIPGKLLMRLFPGQAVRSIEQTFDGAGSFIFQIGDTLQTFTLDELFNRAATPSVTQVVTGEESYGVAYILHNEASTVNGGSLQGYISGTDSASAADSFFGRRLTSMPVNQTVGLLQTVKTFNAATGGAGVASVPGNFILEAGTYYISAWMSYRCVIATGDVVWGLYNGVDFQTYDGTSTPILATISPRPSGSAVPLSNVISCIEASFSFTGADRTFQIRHKTANTTNARNLILCGSPSTLVTSNVDTGSGADVAKNLYGVIQILRTA